LRIGAHVLIAGVFSMKRDETADFADFADWVVGGIRGGRSLGRNELRVL
jgi:hypothetical protein